LRKFGKVLIFGIMRPEYEVAEAANFNGELLRKSEFYQG
jgi:hypothetical protein